jgi:hypothetical protein
MATPEEIAAAREGLTTDQLKWLGNADPTDPFIRARGGLPPLPSQTTIPSNSDVLTAEKYSDGTRTPSKTQLEMLSEQTAGFDTAEDIVNRQNAEFDDQGRMPADIRDQVAGQPKTPASAEWANAKDLRALIRTPSSYLVGPAAGPANKLKDFGGILFPYTPSIRIENQATYGSVAPVHSNYVQYFFKNSSVAPIEISGTFTAQNENEAAIWLGVVHLLRALTKMRWGTDANAGSPPPVCRLEAYGDYVFRNVPVAIQNFSIELSDGVDYISVRDSATYKTSLVPVMSSISINLIPMYSRQEIRDFSVSKWVTGNLKGKGYL